MIDKVYGGGVRCVGYKGDVASVAGQGEPFRVIVCRCRDIFVITIIEAISV